ncbi:MAG: hypothetical protein V2B12_00465 [bacterium]
MQEVAVIVSLGVFGLAMSYFLLAGVAVIWWNRNSEKYLPERGVKIKKRR